MLDFRIPHSYCTVYKLNLPPPKYQSEETKVVSTRIIEGRLVRLEFRILLCLTNQVIWSGPLSVRMKTCSIRVNLGRARSSKWKNCRSVDFWLLVLSARRLFCYDPLRLIKNGSSWIYASIVLERAYLICLHQDSSLSKTTSWQHYSGYSFRPVSKAPIGVYSSCKWRGTLTLIRWSWVKIRLPSLEWA